MLFAPDVPVVGFNTPGFSRLLDLLGIRSILMGGGVWVAAAKGPTVAHFAVPRRAVLFLRHVIIGSWIVSPSLNPVFRANFSHASITRMRPVFLRALSLPRSAKPLTGGARIPSGRCRLVWPAA